MWITLVLSSVISNAIPHYDFGKGEARVRLLQDLNERGTEFTKANQSRYYALSEVEIMRIEIEWLRRKSVAEAEASRRQLDDDLATRGADWARANWYLYRGLGPDQVFAKIDRFREAEQRRIEAELWCRSRFED